MRQRRGDAGALVTGLNGRTLVQQHEHAGKQQERGDERDTQAYGHHPAEINHRLDVAEHQRTESHHGRQGGIQGRPDHLAGCFRHQPVLRLVGIVPQQLPVADHQMDVHGHGQDQHQGDEIGGDHRHIPADEAQQSDHQQPGEGAAEQGQDDPAQLAEDNGQHRYHEHEDAQTEHHEIALDKLNHIVGNHGQAAQVQCPVLLVVRHDFPDVRYHPVILIVQRLLHRLVACVDVFQLSCFLLAETAVVFLGYELVALVLQVPVFRIFLQVELQGRNSAVAADNKLTEQGALRQFLAGFFLVHVLVFQGAGVLRQLQQGPFHDREQRDIDQRGNRGNVLDLLQVIPQPADNLEVFIGKKIALGRECDEQKLAAAVMFIDFPGLPEGLIIFQQQ